MPEFDPQALEAKLRAAVPKDLHATVEVNHSPVGNVHLYITSGSFDGLSYSVREAKVWPALEQVLTRSELLRLSVCVLLTPEERGDGPTEMTGSLG